MTWLTPTIAAIAAAIAVPALVILYFLKLRRRDVEISSTFLWKKAIQDLQANAPFQKLRRNILLLLQLLALAALLTALAQPLRQTLGGSSAKHLLLIDASGSMSSVDAKGPDGGMLSRLEAAKLAARDVVEGLKPPGWFDSADAGQAMVIAFDHGARVVQGFTTDKKLLRDAIDSIQPTDAPTSIAEAYALVDAQAPRQTRTETQADGTIRQYIGPAMPVGTIHLFSDGRLMDPEKMTPHAEDGFIFHSIGGEQAPNVGISGVRASRSLDNPNQLSIFVGIVSTNREANERDVELLLEGAPVAIKSVTIPAAKAPDAGAASQAWVPASTGTVFTMDRPEGGVVTARLARSASGPGDVLDRDDSAWVIVPPAKRLSVAIVTPGSVLWPDVLAGKQYAKLEMVSPAEFDRRKEDPARLAEFDVWVLDGLAPLSKDGAWLPGRFLAVNALPPASAGIGDKGAGPPASMLSWQRDHPALRGLVLDGVVMGQSRLVALAKGSVAKEIATSEAGPAILDVTDGATRAIMVAFDPMESNWPFLESCPVFMAQAVDVLGELGSGGEQGREVRTGDVMRDRVPAEAKDVRVKGVDGVTQSLVPTSAGDVSFGPVKRAGVYSLSWEGALGPRDVEVGGRATRAFAANIADAKESDVSASRGLSLATRQVAGVASEAVGGSMKIWPWLLLGMMGLLLLEWYIYNRKVSV